MTDQVTKAAAQQTPTRLNRSSSHQWADCLSPALIFIPLLRQVANRTSSQPTVNAVLSDYEAMYEICGLRGPPAGLIGEPACFAVKRILYRKRFNQRVLFFSLGWQQPSSSVIQKERNKPTRSASSLSPIKKNQA